MHPSVVVRVLDKCAEHSTAWHLVRCALMTTTMVVAMVAAHYPANISILPCMHDIINIFDM